MCFFMSKRFGPYVVSKAQGSWLLLGCWKIASKMRILPFSLLLEKNLHSLCLSQLWLRAGLTSSSAQMGPASTAASSATGSMTVRTRVMSLAASMVSSMP